MSDGVMSGTRDDKSGEALVSSLVTHGFEVVERRAVADGIENVSECLAVMAKDFAGVVITTGGT